MKNMEEIWNKIEITPHHQSQKMNVSKLSSNFELSKFMRIVKIEIISASVFLVSIGLFSSFIPTESLLFIASVLVISIAYSFYGMILIKKLSPVSNSKKFIEDAIRILKNFSIRLVILSSIILLVVGLVLYYQLNLKNPDKLWWSEGGAFIYFTISFIVLSSIIVYIRVFYWNIILNLKSLLADMNEMISEGNDTLD